MWFRQFIFKAYQDGNSMQESGPADGTFLLKRLNTKAEFVDNVSTILPIECFVLLLLSRRKMVYFKLEIYRFLYVCMYFCMYFN